MSTIQKDSLQCLQPVQNDLLGQFGLVVDVGGGRLWRQGQSIGKVLINQSVGNLLLQWLVAPGLDSGTGS